MRHLACYEYEGRMILSDFSFRRKASECCSEHETNALFVGCGQFQIIESADILDVKNVEDVVHAGANLHIRFVLVHDVTTFGELHKHATTLVGCKIGIVFL